MARNLESATDRLYAAELDEFVERRKQLTRELRKEGDREAAAEVDRLHKPTVAAWAVNQLARREKMQMRSLLASADRLHQAHRKALEGGSLKPLEQARQDEQKAIRALKRSAETILSESGHAATQSNLDRIEETLHAAAVDEQVRELVRDGRLSKEVKAAGLGLDAFAGLTSSPRPSKRTKAEEGKAAKREEARAKHELAKQQLRDSRRAAKDAEQAVRTQEQALERAEGELTSRQADVKAAEKEVERTQKALESVAPRD